jgi:radical SAM protein with 4Fe4S-binding SPASM domain
MGFYRMSKDNEQEDNNLFKHIKIQTNDLCTRKCPWCYFGQMNYKQKDVWLEEELVYKMIDELKDLNFQGRLGLFETNEPLTDPRIYDFLEYAKRKLPGTFHMLITNGDLLDEKVLAKLFKVGLDKLLVSAYDNKVIKKMKKLEHSPLFKERVEIMDLVDGCFYDNRGGNVKWKDAPTPDTPLKADCDRVHKMFYIKPSGRAVSCISDFYETNVVGDIRESSLLDIWFGEEFQKIRGHLDNKNRSFSSLCAKCNYPGQGWLYDHLS